MTDLEIIDCDQGSDEWIQARLGIVTASEFASVMAKGRGGDESKTRRTYMLKLAGEILTGEPQERYSNGYMERGHVMEPDARNMYAFMKGVEPELVGFMKRGRFGASPDSLIQENGLLEIKSKAPHLMLDVLERGVMPSEHIPQVQGQLMVSGRDWCDFVAYWPKLPIFIKRVERDEIYIRNLRQGLDDFIGELDDIVKRYRD